MRLEIRGMPKDSYEACGHDGDIVDLQFSDVANRVEAEARAQVCSLEALRISHCVGYSLGSLISAARPLGARIDGPDFQLQHAMLARVHAKWLSNTNADGGGGVVPTEGGAPAPQPASPLSRAAPSGAGGTEHQELGQPRWTNIENMLNGAYHVIYTAPIVVGEPRAVPRAALQMHRYDGPIGDAVDPAAPHTATPPPEPPASARDRRPVAVGGPDPAEQRAEAAATLSAELAAEGDRLGAGPSAQCGGVGGRRTEPSVPAAALHTARRHGGAGCRARLDGSLRRGSR